MDDFSVSHERERGCEVVALAGELDIDTTYTARATLEPLVDEGEGPIVVDLSGVGFVDSTAIAMLVTMRRKLREAGRGFAIVGQTGPVGRLFALTGLEQELGLVATRDAAFDAVGAGSASGQA